MKKIFLMSTISIVILSLASLSCSSNIKSETEVIEVSKNLMLRLFPDIKFHEIGIQPSQDFVNFVYDKLYKINMIYEKERKIKRLEFNIGIYKKTFLTPPEFELLELDKNAKVIFDKSEK